MKIFKDILSFVNVIKTNRSLSVLKTNKYSYCLHERHMSLRCTSTSNTLLDSLKSSQKNFLLKNVHLSRNLFTSVICTKSKDRGGKEKKKPKASKIDVNVINELFDAESLMNDMNQVIENLKTDFIKNLTLRSTTGSLEQIPVSLDGKDYQLQELAQIARKPKIIVLNVAAFPTAIPHILKAIEKSGLNINPQQDGTTIFLPIPK